MIEVNIKKDLSLLLTLVVLIVGSMFALKIADSSNTIILAIANYIL